MTRDEIVIEPNAVLEAHGQSCARLTPLIKGKMRELESGAILEVRANDPAAREDIASWSRLTGNELMGTADDGPDGTRFYLRKK